MELNAAELAQRLAHYTGSVAFTRHPLMRNMHCTDGTTFLMNHGVAWFIDVIASYQSQANVKAEPFQNWILKVDVEKHTAVVTMDDGRTKREIVRQEIEYTDFPLSELKVYLIEEGDHSTCLLASEY